MSGFGFGTGVTLSGAATVANDVLFLASNASAGGAYVANYDMNPNSLVAFDVTVPNWGCNQFAFHLISDQQITRLRFPNSNAMEYLLWDAGSNSNVLVNSVTLSNGGWLSNAPAFNPMRVLSYDSNLVVTVASNSYICTVPNWTTASNWTNGSYGWSSSNYASISGSNAIRRIFAESTVVISDPCRFANSVTGSNANFIAVGAELIKCSNATAIGNTATSNNFIRSYPNSNYTTKLEYLGFQHGGNSTSALREYEGGEVTTTLSIGGGFVGINNSNAAYPLDVAGSIRASDAVIASNITASNLACPAGSYSNLIASNLAVTSLACTSIQASNGVLHFGSNPTNTIISLYAGSFPTNTATSVYGFGVNSGVLRYNTSGTASSHVFFGGSSEAARITGTGRLGILNAAPSCNLDVTGTARITSNLQVDTVTVRNGTLDVASRMISALDSSMPNNSQRYITLGKAASSFNQAEISYQHIGDTNTSNSLYLGFYNKTVLRMTAAGNVSINGGAPTCPLDVTGVAKFSSDVIISGSLTAANIGASANSNFTYAGVSSDGFISSSDFNRWQGNYTTFSTSNIRIAGFGSLEFGCNVAKQQDAGKIGYQTFSSNLDIVGAGTVAPGRTIRMYDSVGIGKDPATQLDVAGNCSVSGGITATSLASRNLAVLDPTMDSATNYSKTFSIGKATTSGNCGVISYTHEADNGGTGPYNGVRLTVQGQNGVFVNAAGNVGINYNTPGYPLHVNGTIKSTGLITAQTGMQINDGICSGNRQFAMHNNSMAGGYNGLITCQVGKNTGNYNSWEFSYYHNSDGSGGNQVNFGFVSQTLGTIQYNNGATFNRPVTLSDTLRMTDKSILLTGSNDNNYIRYNSSSTGTRVCGSSEVSLGYTAVNSYVEAIKVAPTIAIQKPITFQATGSGTAIGRILFAQLSIPGVSGTNVVYMHVWTHMYSIPGSYDMFFSVEDQVTPSVSDNYAIKVCRKGTNDADIQINRCDSPNNGWTRAWKLNVMTIVHD